MTEIDVFCLARCLQTGTELGEIASRIGEPREIEQAESPEVGRPPVLLHSASALG